MISRLRRQGILGLALGLFLQAAAPALAAEAAAPQPEYERVRFSTADSVELRGRFYPAAAKRRDTCVLLLHDLQARAGNISEGKSWMDFAGSLQKAGYDVLSFDFRGFGGSTSVGPQLWNRSKYAYNQLIRNAVRKPESIHHKDFPPQYFPYLVNDVAAARAFLDRRNDRGEVNSSNLVVIGVGEGATVGLLWMAAECRLQRDAVSPFPVRHVLHDPQGRDLACAVWLDISSTLAGRRLPLSSLIKDVVQKGKVRTAFLSTEATADAASLDRYVEEVNRGQRKKLAHARRVGTTSRRRWGWVLSPNSEATQWILEDCLPTALEARGLYDRRVRDAEKDAFVWSFPWPRQAGSRFVLAKAAGEPMLRPLPIPLLIGR